MEEDGKKSLIIGLLLATICIIAIGYATLAQELSIFGTAQFNGSWDVHLEPSSLKVTDKSDTAKVNDPPMLTSETISIDLELLQPGDFVTYTVDIVNNGSIDAKLRDLSVIQQALENDVSSQVEWTFSGISKGDVIKANKKQSVTLTAVFPDTEVTVETGLTRTITVIFDFTQNS